MLSEEILARSLTWDQARGLRDQEFQLVPETEGEAPIALRIVEIREGHRNDRFVQFAITLRGPAEPLLPQRTYHFRHEHLGDYAFLITAIARTEGGIDYEACFSHAA
jgi:hypothetical protein